METSTVRTARKSHRCTGDRCDNTITPGERYRDYVVFPGHEFLAVETPQHWRMCSACADRYGKPIPQNQETAR